MSPHAKQYKQAALRRGAGGISTHLQCGSNSRVASAQQCGSVSASQQYGISTAECLGKLAVGQQQCGSSAAAWQCVGSSSVASPQPSALWHQRNSVTVSRCSSVWQFSWQQSSRNVAAINAAVAWHLSACSSSSSSSKVALSAWHTQRKQHARVTLPCTLGEHRQVCFCMWQQVCI